MTTDSWIKSHDLRDLISRSYSQGEVISVLSSDTLERVYGKMKTFDVSQIPVIENNQIVGLIDETDLLRAVVGNPQGFNAQVGSVMINKLVTLEVTASVNKLLPIFEAGQVALVVEKGNFVGLITPLDFVNYLRKEPIKHGQK